ncbi:MAG: hypothetical protein ACI4F1_05970 [Bariatricus sp.]
MKNLHKIGKFYTRIIMKNVGIFIFIGLLSVIFNSHGWLPNEDIYAISQLVYKMVLPCMIAYDAGNKMEENGGGVLAVLALSGILAVRSEIGMLGAMLIGPAAGFIWSKENAWIKNHVGSSIQMLVRNLALALTGVMFAFAGYFLALPILAIVTDMIEKGIGILVDRGMVIFLSVLIEPAKVFFLNNIVNHSILVPIAMGQLDKTGSSILFLLESNPGPGLGILAALWFVKREKKSEYLSAIVAEAAGGIHEVYFPYVLTNLRLLVPLILGAISGNAVFEFMNVGAGGTISPGSIFIVLLMAGKENVPGVMAGVAISALISFAGGILVLRTRKGKESSEDQKECRMHQEEQKKVEWIVFVCDGGVGSSAMGAALFRRTLAKEHMEGIKVEAAASDMIPVEADLIVCQKEFRRMLPENIEGTKIYTLENLVSTAEYGCLMELIRKRNG